MPARRALSLISSLVAPPRCAVCGAGCDPVTPTCDPCEAALAAAAPVVAPLPGLDACWSAARYEGTARELVGALKFRRLLPLARVAAAAIATAVPFDLLGGSLVPVPPAPLRLRARGLDPAEEIAAELSGLTGLGIVHCLARTQGPRQVGRPRRERIGEPPRIALRAAPPDVAILVDDVVTTGATLGACATALRAGGAARVVALTFARSEKAFANRAAGRTM
jgi:predicted amidophosphoribosyltransferase